MVAKVALVIALAELSIALGGMVHDGGPGSGNFGHAGRPGEVGGSSSAEGGSAGEARRPIRYDWPQEVRSAARRLNVKGVRLENGNVAIGYNPKGAKADIDLISKHKEEIKPVLAAELEEEEAEQRKEKERQAKIDGIEGLEEVRKAWLQKEIYREDYRRYISDPSRYEKPAEPDNQNEILRKYPRATAYMQAKAYTQSKSVENYSAGKRAMERIENGEPHDRVIAEMKEEASNALAEAASRL